MAWEDIQDANGLAGVMPDEGVQIYRAGFLAALTAVGLALGVDWQDTPTRNSRATTIARY